MKIRNARIGDVDILSGIKAAPAFHRDRIRDAEPGVFEYLLLLDNDQITGLVCLLYSWPEPWEKSLDRGLYPRIVDLHIADGRRGQGAGTEFLNLIEEKCRGNGFDRLYLSVDPKDNSEAHSFYKKNGYTDLASEPKWIEWSFTDSSGKTHSGEGWDVDMVKYLGLADSHQA